MYGVRVPVLQRQFADHAGELKGGAIRCREGAVAAGFRFHGAENISGAATLVLVIAPRFPPRLGRDVGRTSAGRVTGFSSKQTTGSAGSYGFSYVFSTSSILAL